MEPLEYYEFIRNNSKEDISDEAAALLVLASVIHDKKLYTQDLGHEICMGIRHGLFNSGDGDLYTALSQLKRED